MVSGRDFGALGNKQTTKWLPALSDELAAKWRERERAS